MISISRTKRGVLATNLLVVVLFITLITTFVLVVGAAKRIEDPLYSVLPSGAVTDLHGQKNPFRSTKTVLAWANLAAVAAYSYDFSNYSDRLKEASAYFTPHGWDDFMNALNASNSIAIIKARRLQVSAVASGTPVVLQEGPLFGIYTWRVKMPLLVTYQSASAKTQQALLVTMLIQQVPIDMNPRGIGIEQMQVAPITSAAR